MPSGHASEHQRLDGDGALRGFPIPLSSFVGRTRERAQVVGLLREHRLVTLTGPGGGGKTRLALEVATEVVPCARERGVFVDLAPVESSALVVNSVAAACGVSETGAVPLAELMARVLADQQLLLLLDNCEGVVDECGPLVHQLLTRCAHVVVLATSRAPLGVDGEVTFRVPPLSLPPVDADDPERVLRESEAGQLFLDRAELARPGHPFTARDSAAAATVCRSLDGIPLAIELAASRLRVLDPPALADALGERFDLLGRGPRTAPPRQRTLEASIDWSYDLLDERERRLFRRLGVFAGPFTAETAAAVCGDTELRRERVPVLLAELADRSLVQLKESSDTTRYRLLDTVREYALRKLEATDERAATRSRHLDHHLAVAEDFDRELATASALDAVMAVLDDLRAAMDWSLESKQVQKGLRLAASLRAFWIGRSRTDEGRVRLAGLLLADDAFDVLTRARALVVDGLLAHYAADTSRVKDVASEALKLGRSAGDIAIEGEALLLLGWADVFLEPVAARSVLTKGLFVLEGARHDRYLEFGRVGAAVALLNAGELSAAASAFVEGLEAARVRGTWGRRFGLGILGYVRALQARLDNAELLLREATADQWGLYDRFNEDLVPQWLAFVLTLRGRYQEAASVFDDALERTATRGGQPMLGALHRGLLALAVGEFGEATSRASDALPGFRRIGWRWFESQTLRVLGDCAAGGGDLEAAAARWRAAASAADASENPVARSFATLGLARGATWAGDLGRARTLARDALRYALSVDYRVGAVDAFEALAVLSAAEISNGGSAPDAGRLLAAVESERTRLGYVRFPVDRPGFERAVGGVRDAMGSAFETMWAEGSALPFEEAVALASRGERRPPRPPSGWASLTPAELRVADLVTEGLTNPEIGERLFVSPRTVQTHLSRVFAKLEVSGRAELAAALSRHRSAADVTG